MKQLIYKVIRVPVVLLLSVATMLQGCEDNDLGGAPVITNVRLLDPVKADSSIKGALPGTQIVIQGENLSGLQKAYFNDFEATFNSALNSDRNVIILIPAEAPTKAVNSEVPDKIRLVTSSGEVSYDFSLTSPSPVIWRLYSEFVKPGGLAVIYGNYFYNIESVKLGATNLEIVNRSVTRLTVKLPATVSVDYITINGEFGTVRSGQKLNDPVGNLINFDIPATSWGSAVCWGAAQFTDTLDALSGKYWLVKGTSLPSTGWNDSWAMGTCGFDFQLAPGAARDRQLKFEVNAKEAWKGGQVNIELKVGGTSYLHVFKPWDTPALRANGYLTDGWQTETIELADFLSGSSTIADVSKISDVTIWYNTPDAAVDKMDVSFDNFRIVRK